MKSEEMLELLNGIDSDLVENARKDVELYESSREGVSFRAEYSRKRTLKTVIMSFAATAAAVFGLFVLLNVVKSGAFLHNGSPNSSEASEINTSGQVFTKDYDGLVLTVTTDKSTYKIGEPINLTATLENNTGEDIYLWQDGPGYVSTTTMRPRFSDLVEYPISGRYFGYGDITILPFNQGEKCVQNFTFQTYTSYIANAEGVTETGEGVVYTPDHTKAALPGVYTGELQIKTCPSDEEYPFSSDEISTYTLEFSVTVTGEIFESENKGQTFTKDYDGLVLTVTTDKAEYNIGEPIELTATLENNRDDEVYLYYDMSPANYDVDLSPRFEHLIEYPYYIRTFDAVITVVPFGPGEKHVQKFTFRTYTDYVEIANEDGGILWTPDLNKPAAPGVYNGSLLVFTSPSKEYYSGITELTPHELEFSVTVNGETSESENKGQTFTKDYEGLVLTVTTDKAEYNIGEPIHLTATLENNRNEDIYLYYGNAPIDFTVELSPRFEDLIEYPHEIFVRNTVVTLVTVKPGEKYVQDFTFLTYTDYIEGISDPGGIEYYPDYSKPAAPGTHNGKLSIGTCSDEGNYDDITEYTLDFSVKVNGETSKSENKGQTFTEDFDGLVLTVTTDKSTYNIGEPIELTATLENNTGKDITLYYGTCGMYGYDGQKAGTAAELLPRFEKLIEYPIRSAVWIDDAITEIPFRQGEKCVQKFTFQTYTDYYELADPPQTGEFKDAVIPDLNKIAESGVHYGKLPVMFYSDGEARDHITDCTLDFSVTVTSSN